MSVICFTVFSCLFIFPFRFVSAVDHKGQPDASDRLKTKQCKEEIRQRQAMPLCQAFKSCCSRKCGVGKNFYSQCQQKWGQQNEVTEDTRCECYKT
uniref:Uncharacterized protein n=1 Tax=Romanomermis culicivorax TaxID=13658 RepID=A0A915I8R0_ROMCU